MTPRRSHSAAAILHIDRRLLGRLLLSLVLLWSQQAVFAHALTHVQQAASTGSKSLLQDLACADCLAHAQLSAALGSTAPGFAIATPVPVAIILPATDTACLVTVCAFQPRAPPQA
jgi:hypothetical protein